MSLNSLKVRQEISAQYETRSRSVDLAFAAAVALLNIFELYLLYQVRKRKHYENILISLSFADLLFGVSNVLVCTVFLADVEKHDVLQIFNTTFLFFVVTSILHLFLINFDRLWMISKPIKHKIYFTSQRVKQALAVLWVLSIVVSVSLLLANEYTSTFKTVTRRSIVIRNGNGTGPSVNQGNLSSLVVSELSVDTTTITPLQSNLIPQTNTTMTRTPNVNTFEIETQSKFEETMKDALSYIIIVADVTFIACNIVIVYILSRHQKKMVHQIPSSSIKNNSMAKERKVSVICLIVTLTFVLFTFPFAVMKLFSSTNAVPFWANILLVVNSGMNSIVYFFRARIEKLVVQWFWSKDEDSDDSHGNETLPPLAPVSPSVPAV